MQSGSNVIPFPSNRRRDQAIVEHYRRRLAFERKMMRGDLTKLEKVEGHMELTAELLFIAEQFGL